MPPALKPPFPQRKIVSRSNHAAVSIVGLGCSSFSAFFQKAEDPVWDPSSELSPSDATVQTWIETIHHAIESGITLLDTAPWYGHGSSEKVIGFAMEELSRKDPSFQRSSIQINTKVGRYEAEVSKQFDFSKEMTLMSAQRSVDRMRCGYVDVLQLHDPEFAPSLEQLMDETIPALIECREKGLCRAIGITGYPLSVQHLILVESMKRFGKNVWDQSLTYSHFNLHDSSLVTKPFGSSQVSFLQICRSLEFSMELCAAAPLSMGLLTRRGPPDWHPASPVLQSACRKASKLCDEKGVDIANLALLFALSHPDIPCTILGMKNVDEVRRVHEVATRIGPQPNVKTTQEQVLEAVCTPVELELLHLLQDPDEGPFAAIRQNEECEWDGIQEAWNFWKQVPGVKTTQWQRP